MKHRSLFILFALALVVAFARPSLAQNDIGIQFDRVDDDRTPEVDDAGFPGLRLILTPMNPSGVPIGTVWTRLHAARRELRRALTAEGEP